MVKEKLKQSKGGRGGGGCSDYCIPYIPELYISRTKMILHIVYKWLPHLPKLPL